MILPTPSHVPSLNMTSNIWTNDRFGGQRCDEQLYRRSGQKDAHHVSHELVSFGRRVNAVNFPKDLSLRLCHRVQREELVEKEQGERVSRGVVVVLAVSGQRQTCKREKGDIQRDPRQWQQRLTLNVR